MITTELRGPGLFPVPSFEKIILKVYLLLAEYDYGGDSKCGLTTNEDLAKRWVAQQTEWHKGSYERYKNGRQPHPEGYEHGDSYSYLEIEINDASIKDILEHKRGDSSHKEN